MIICHSYPFLLNSKYPTSQSATIQRTEYYLDQGHIEGLSPGTRTGKLDHKHGANIT